VPEATPEFKQLLREAFDEMYVGQTFTFRRTFTDGDVALFCGVTGDYNPYHQDEAFSGELLRASDHSWPSHGKHAHAHRGPPGVPRHRDVL
jgi:acyl dehydratase